MYVPLTAAPPSPNPPRLPAPPLAPQPPPPPPRLLLLELAPALPAEPPPYEPPVPGRIRPPPPPDDTDDTPIPEDEDEWPTKVVDGVSYKTNPNDNLLVDRMTGVQIGYLDDDGTIDYIGNGEDVHTENQENLE